MKHITILFFPILLLSFAKAQPGTIDTATARVNMKIAADTMGQLFLHKSYVAYTKYVHPNLVKMLGGPEKFIEVLKTSLRQIDRQGLEITDVVMGETSNLLVTSTDLQSVIPQTITLTSATGRIRSVSYLIGVSKDKGKSWYFIDTSNKTLAQLKTVFPSLSSKLVIPEKSKPVFSED